MSNVCHASLQISIHPLCDKHVKLIKQRFSELKFHEQPKVDKLTLKHAAVLVLLCRSSTNADVHVLLTRRSKFLKHYAGDISLPGGLQELSDKSLADTALREAREEIGLSPSMVDIFAKLPIVLTRYGHVVVPYCGFLKATFVPVLQASEVDVCFLLPLRRFLTNNRHWEHPHELSSSFIYLLHCFEDEIFNTSHEKESVMTYGLTAAICITAATIVIDKLPDFSVSTWTATAGNLPVENVQDMLNAFTSYATWLYAYLKNYQKSKL